MIQGIAWKNRLGIVILEYRVSAKQRMFFGINFAIISDWSVMTPKKVVRILLYVMQLFITNENVLEYGILTITHLAVHATCNEQLCQAHPP